MGLFNDKNSLICTPTIKLNKVKGGYELSTTRDSLRPHNLATGILYYEENDKRIKLHIKEIRIDHSNLDLKLMLFK